MVLFLPPWSGKKYFWLILYRKVKSIYRTFWSTSKNLINNDFYLAKNSKIQKMNLFTPHYPKWYVFVVAEAPGDFWQFHCIGWNNFPESILQGWPIQAFGDQYNSNTIISNGNFNNTIQPMYSSGRYNSINLNRI